jgi:hypothetical protein
VWQHFKTLDTPATNSIVGNPFGLGPEGLGYARYVDTEALMKKVMLNEKLVKTMDFTLRNTRGLTEKRVLVMFSVDGAGLHSNASGVFGFLRVLNQVDYVDSPLMQFPVLLAQTTESRTFFGETLPRVLGGLAALEATGIDVVCTDENCDGLRNGVACPPIMTASVATGKHTHHFAPGMECTEAACDGVGGVATMTVPKPSGKHTHSLPVEVAITCDLKAMKEIVNRQGGTPSCGCLVCDGNTKHAHSTGYTRGKDFTDADLVSMHNEWEALMDKYNAKPSVTKPLTAGEFEDTPESKTWSQDNRGFAGPYALRGKVKIEQYHFDTLHMMLRLVPVLVHPIVDQVTDLIERGYDGVKLFAEGMELIGLGHIAARFEEKYAEKLGEIQKKQKEDKRAAKEAAATAAAAAATAAADVDEEAAAGAGVGWGGRGRGRARGGRGRGAGSKQKKRARSPPAAEPQGPYNAPALTYEQAAPDVDKSNEVEACRQAMQDHNVVKFIGTLHLLHMCSVGDRLMWHACIGRDCRALERGYKTLLACLNESSESFLHRMRVQHANIQDERKAADVAIGEVNGQLEDMSGGAQAAVVTTDGAAADMTAELQRLNAELEKVEAKQIEICAKIAAVVAGGRPEYDEKVPIYVCFGCAHADYIHTTYCVLCACIGAKDRRAVGSVFGGDGHRQETTPHPRGCR